MSVRDSTIKTTSGDTAKATDRIGVTIRGDVAVIDTTLASISGTATNIII